jgi:hypothetical protein
VQRAGALHGMDDGLGHLLTMLQCRAEGRRSAREGLSTAGVAAALCRGPAFCKLVAVDGILTVNGTSYTVYGEDITPSSCSLVLVFVLSLLEADSLPQAVVSLAVPGGTIDTGGYRSHDGVGTG